MLGECSIRSDDALIVAPVIAKRRSSWGSLGLKQQNQHALADQTGLLVQHDTGVASRWAAGAAHSAEIEVETLQKEAGTPAYEIMEQLGEGSFAKCVRLREVDTGQVFAGKLCPKRELTPGQQRKLNRLGNETKLGLLGVATEIELHSSLMHRCIVRFHEYFFDQVSSKLCMVLEHCANGTLRRVLQRVPDKVLPQHAVQRWMYMLMDALSYMHSCGIVHRDLNPDNLLIDEMLALKICDFGFAARVTTAGQQLDSAAAAEAVGTLNYIAPEVLLRDCLAAGGSDLRAADVWAAGVVMHEALLGRVPFLLQENEEPAVEVLQQVDAPAQLCVESVDFIAATLHRTPDCRPTAETLLDHAFFGGSFCAFPGTKVEIELRTAAVAATEAPADTDEAVAVQQDRVGDMMLALPPSPPRENEGLAVVLANTSATTTQPRELVAGYEVLLAGMPIPQPRPVGTSGRAVQIPVGDASNRRALAISPGRCNPEARARYESGIGGEEYRAAIAAALDTAPQCASSSGRSSTISTAVAKHQPLASRFLHSLGVPMIGMRTGTPAGPGSAPGPNSSSTNARSSTPGASDNIGLDEETMSWVLLLQLDPLLDARWITAAQQHLWRGNAAAVAVAALSDDDSGSDGDVAVSGEETAMTVTPTAMTLSPERDRTALWHLPGARVGGGRARRAVAQQQGHGPQRKSSS
eukprot:COSAG02_NODE_48_length_45421_cov_103.222100_33_plen_694_part_00